MMLKTILCLPLKTLSERHQQQRQLLAMKIMLSERSLVPLPRFQKIGGVMGRFFEKKMVLG